MAFVTQPKENILDGEALTFADLPTATFDNNGLVYLVENDQGSRWTLNHKKAGLYKSNGVRWVYLGVEIPQATNAEMESLASTDIRRMSPDNLNTAIDSKALPSATQDEMFHLSESSDRAISPYLVGEAIATKALPVMTLAERNDLDVTESRAVSPDDLRIVVSNGLPSRASAAEVTSLTGTRARLFTPANIGTAIQNNSLSSMSLAERNALIETADRTMSPNDIRQAVGVALPSITLAERNALTEIQDRAVSPNDLRVAIDSRLPPTATAAEITSLSSTDVKLLSPANIGVAIENNSLPSMSLAERNSLTETADRAVSPNDIRVILGNNRTAQATTAEVEAMALTEPRLLSPRDLATAIDSKLPSISLAERAALSETEDRAMSPNDISVMVDLMALPWVRPSEISNGSSIPNVSFRVQQVLEVVARNKHRDDLRSLRANGSYHFIENGGTYFLSGLWNTTKTVYINTTEDVEIIGENGGTLNTGSSMLFEVEAAKSLTISNLTMQNTLRLGMWVKNEVELNINNSYIRSGITCITFNGGGSINLKSSSFNSGTGSSSVVLGANSAKDNKYVIEDCLFDKNNPVDGRINYIYCLAETQVFTVKGCVFERIGTRNSVPIRFANHRAHDVINILNNKVKNGRGLYQSDVSGSWGNLNCSGNIDNNNIDFRPTNVNSTDATTLHKPNQAKLFRVQNLQSNQPGNWARIGTTPSSVAQRIGLEFTLPEGYVSTVTGAISFRSPTEDGSFRWGALELWKGDTTSPPNVTWTRVFIREQGASNSEGVDGYDYASVSLTFTEEILNSGQPIRYRITVDSASPNVHYRYFRADVLSIARIVPHYVEE